MTVPEPPQQLVALSEVEIRLVSRIVPFVKIIKLGGRFGQKGFKGQAVLFAQQVEEITEQLPMAIEQCGLTVVIETLENVDRVREYRVNLDNLRAALNWLVNNNHLYRGITLNFEHLQNSRNDEHIIKIPTTTVNQNREPHQHFKVINSERKILRGTFNQGSDMFSSNSRGKQCTANAAAAIAYSSTKDLSQWDASDIDRVLIFGDAYYSQCLRTLPIQPNYLNTEELLPE